MHLIHSLCAKVRDLVEPLFAIYSFLTYNCIYLGKIFVKHEKNKGKKLPKAKFLLSNDGSDNPNRLLKAIND